MKILNEVTFRKCISKEFIIEIGYGLEIKIVKWADDYSDGETDTGYEFADSKSKELYNTVSEQLAEEIDEFIAELVI